MSKVVLPGSGRGWQMDPHAPVTGNLLLTGRDQEGSSVVLLDGATVAYLRSGPPLRKMRFTLLDVDGRPVAEGAQGVSNWRDTEVWAADRTPVLTITSGFRTRPWRLTLRAGRHLTVWAERPPGRSPVLDADGVEVATVRSFDRSARYGPHAVDLPEPVLSVVQAAALAEYVRKRVGAWLEPDG